MQLHLPVLLAATHTDFEEMRYQLSEQTAYFFLGEMKNVLASLALVIRTGSPQSAQADGGITSKIEF